MKKKTKQLISHYRAASGVFGLHKTSPAGKKRRKSIATHMKKLRKAGKRTPTFF